MLPKEVHDHGNGTLLAVYADGSEYVFRPASADPAPKHVELCAAHAEGKLKIVPRPARNVTEVRDHYLHMADVIFGTQLPAPASSEAYKHKLEEARDVMDLMHTPGGKEEIAALDSVQRVTRWPMLMAGIGIDGETLESCAEIVHRKAMDLRLRQHAAERSRLSLKAALRQAPTAEAVEAAFLAHQGIARPDVAGS